MKEKIKALKNSPFVNGVKYFLESAYFPFLCAAIALLCYYTGLDVLLLCYLGLTAILIILLLEDISPLINFFLYVRVCISAHNNPDYDNIGLSNWNMLVPAIVIGVFVVAAIIYRFVIQCRSGNFKPTNMLYGMIAFSAVIFLGGLGAKD